MADIERILSELLDGQTELVMRVAEYERRMDNMVRHGKVTDVDTKKHLARIEIGERDGKPLKSAWIPYGQVAGEYKSHRPPTKGQQMTMFAPNGEVRQAMLLPFTWSDDNKAPSDKEDEHVDTYGDKFKIVRKKDHLSFTVDKSSITFEPGKITVNVDGSKTVWTKENITNTSPEVKDVGISKLGLKSEDSETKKTVVEGDQKSPRVLIDNGDLEAESDLVS
jgi:phage baseplate assembly protein V